MYQTITTFVILYHNNTEFVPQHVYHNNNFTTTRPRFDCLPDDGLHGYSAEIPQKSPGFHCQLNQRLEVASNLLEILKTKPENFANSAPEGSRPVM